MKKRIDIQIARTIAILAVLGFHLGIPGFGNGFLGVDIFFVISGYLMGLLYHDIGPIEFYKRRIRRIYPSLLATLILVFLVGSFILQPFELEILSGQILMGIFGLSNVSYWSQNSYFQSGEFRPLLNLWSLGVEIQFYLLFPFLLFLKRKSQLFLPLVATLSLMLSFILVQVSPKTSFFLLPGRLWEFLVGIIVSNPRVFTKLFSTRRYVLFLGLIIFVGSLIIPVNTNSLNWLFGHPGLHALAVCSSTAILLGLQIPTKSFSSVIVKVSSKLGDISYEIYLLHFPLLAFLNYEPFSGTVTAVENLEYVLMVLICTFTGSLILYRCSQFYKIRRPIVLLLGITILATLTTTNAVARLKASQSSEVINRTSFAMEDRAEYRCGKLFRVFNPLAKLCLVSPVNNSLLPNVLLFGNSHADMIKSEVVRVADGKANIYFWVQNSPFEMEIEEIISTIEQFRIQKVLLHSSPFVPEISKLKALLEKTTKIDYVMLGSVPTYSMDVPRIVFNEIESQGGGITALNIDSYLTLENLKADEPYQEIEFKNFKFVSIIDYWCITSKCSWRDSQGNLYYFDTGHITLTGARSLNRPIVTALESLLNKS